MDIERVHMWGYGKKDFPYGSGSCSTEQLLTRVEGVVSAGSCHLLLEWNLLREGQYLKLEWSPGVPSPPVLDVCFFIGDWGEGLHS